MWCVWMSACGLRDPGEGAEEKVTCDTEEACVLGVGHEGSRGFLGHAES